MTDSIRVPLGDLRALAEKAIPGPWTLGRASEGNGWWPQVWPAEGAPIADFNGRTGAPEKDAADAAYIAAISPDVTIALLDALDAATARALAAEEALQDWVDWGVALTATVGERFNEETHRRFRMSIDAARAILAANRTASGDEG